MVAWCWSAEMAAGQHRPAPGSSPPLHCPAALAQLSPAAPTLHQAGQLGTTAEAAQNTQQPPPSHRHLGSFPSASGRLCAYNSSPSDLPLFYKRHRIAASFPAGDEADVPAADSPTPEQPGSPDAEAVRRTMVGNGFADGQRSMRKHVSPITS